MRKKILAGVVLATMIFSMGFLSDSCLQRKFVVLATIIFSVIACGGNGGSTTSDKKQQEVSLTWQDSAINKINELDKEGYKYKISEDDNHKIYVYSTSSLVGEYMFNGGKYEAAEIGSSWSQFQYDTSYSKDEVVVYLSGTAELPDKENEAIQKYFSSEDSNEITKSVASSTTRNK